MLGYMAQYPGSVAFYLLLVAVCCLLARAAEELEKPQPLIAAVVVLTVMCLGLGLWLDLTQRHTAREYLDALDVVRREVLENRMDSAAHEQAYLHARWQYDAGWLNFLIGHHHTRAVTSAMLHLSTALEQRWRDETLRALDEVVNALSEVESSDFATLENIL